MPARDRLVPAQYRALADLVERYGVVIVYPAHAFAFEVFAGDHVFVVEHDGETIHVQDCGDGLDLGTLAA